MLMTRSNLPAAIVLLTTASHAGDWPQWCGTYSKNMVSTEKNLPVEFSAGKRKKGTEEVDVATTVNCRWVVKLGSQSYGTPAVAGGKILVGTNNENPRDPTKTGDRAIIMCVDEKTGAFQWQLVVPKLGAGKVSDWEYLGMCTTPFIEGDRAYLVTNRCEIVCIDMNGMANGNDGPFKDEAEVLHSGRRPRPAGARSRHRQREGRRCHLAV